MTFTDSRWSEAGDITIHVPMRGSQTFEVLPPGRSDVRRVADESLRPAMTAAMRVTSIGPPSPTTTETATLLLDCDALPQDVAFDVCLVQDGVEKTAGQLVVRAADAPARRVVGLQLDSLQPGLADVLLRPSETAARASIDIFDIWDGELRYNGVPIRLHGRS